MTGAAIGSAVMGGVSLIGASKAASASASASAYQMQLATDQYNYQMGQMDNYQNWMAGGMDFVAGLSFGGAGYTADLLDPEKYTNQQGIEIAQEMMDNWANTFGGLEENLSEYFNNLDPDKYAIQSKIALQENLDKSLTQFNETMAAKGLQSSGMQQQVAKEAMFAQAAGNASIDINADDVVAQQQMGFLQYGQAEKLQAGNLLSNATNIGEQMKFEAAASNQQATNAAAAFNANAANQAAMARSSAMTGMYGAVGQSMYAGTQITDPRIAIQGQTAANYGASQSGYMDMAGSMFGSAINLGIQGGLFTSSNPSAPFGGIDDGWGY